MNNSDDKDEKPSSRAPRLSKQDQDLWDAYMGVGKTEYEDDFEKLLNQGTVKKRASKKKTDLPEEEKQPEKKRPSEPKNTQVDRRTEEKLRKGQMAIEATLDLHGMVQQEAYPALENFMVMAVRRKLRCVLVITGKGRPRLATENIIEPEQGVLKKNVPHWLKGFSMSGNILKITSAHTKHGGSGALYVYLRKQR